MRKKGANGQESRARLLTVAASEFARSGYHKTKISTIVSRAGLTQPSFYLYFESKEAVFNELMDKFRLQLKELVMDSKLEAGISREDVPARIRAVVANLFGFLERDPDLTQIGFFIGEGAEEVKEELTSILTQNLKAEQAAGYFHQEVEMGIVAESLVGTIERLTLQELLSGKRTSEELAHQVVSLYLFGISAHRES